MTRLEPIAPLVAIVGPTNAGKSTLFNRLTGSWQAVTAKETSTTRDRIYGDVSWRGLSFSVVDTGGLAKDKTELYKNINSQTVKAVEEADLVLFLYDGQVGLSSEDKQFLRRCRQQKKIYLVANKADSETIENKIADLEYLDLPHFKIAAASGRGVGDLLDETLNAVGGAKPADQANRPVIAIVGRPNVGKSTLLNALTESDRAVVSPVAGTTRDIVTGEIQLKGKKFLLADTAGVRRRGKIQLGPEQFSVKRTLAVIKAASAVMVIVDATEGTTRGDLHLIYFADSLKKPVMIVFNKTDLLENPQDIRGHHHISRFDWVGVSALNKQGLEQLTKWLDDLPLDSEQTAPSN